MKLTEILIKLSKRINSYCEKHESVQKTTIYQYEKILKNGKH